MNGTTLTRALLLLRPQLLFALGTAPAGRIVVGIIPAGATLPAIGITEVVTTEHVPLTGTQTATVMARVQVSVAATTIKETKLILAQVKYACRNFVGTLSALPNVKVQLLETGPDFEHEAGFAMQSQDVRVTFRDAPSN